MLMIMKVIQDFSGNNAWLDNIIIKVFNNDINLDDKRDILDLEIIANSYNQDEYDESWDIRKDFNEDKIIDIFDITKIAKTL